MKRLLMGGAVLALALAWTGAADAVSPAGVNVTTEVIAGNPKCGGVKIEAEDIHVGTYGPITITAYNGTTISWTSSEGVGEVIVKGGPNALVYHYNPPATGDTGLHAPVNPNNDKYYGISHVEFCRFAKK
ncbi:MAG TPA: hypothetical protein VGQ20_03680 [Acidimicrobiales bacterium]|jgi:hypothetical protein|nr:hypothetical protein [Acidimicrobiales bacterium]